MKISIYLYILFFSLLFTPASGNTHETDRLNRVINGTIKAIYDENPAEKNSTVLSIIEAEYDLTVIIRRAIGRNWKLMSATERQMVLSLVKQLIVKAYVDGISSDTRPVINMDDPVMVSEKRMEISSTVYLHKQKVNILYRLGKMNTGWQIYDIVAEDISFVSNYRQQIDAHFRKSSGAELINKLEKLLTKEDLNENLQI